jgi:hypothetical protein
MIVFLMLYSAIFLLILGFVTIFFRNRVWKLMRFDKREGPEPPESWVIRSLIFGIACLIGGLLISIWVLEKLGIFLF